MDTDRPGRKPPRLTEQAQAQKAARAAREAEALRENLRKRKEQVRAREGSQDGPAKS